MIETPYILRIFEVPQSKGRRACAFLSDYSDESRQDFLQSLEPGSYEILIRPLGSDT